MNKTTTSEAPASIPTTEENTTTATNATATATMSIPLVSAIVAKKAPLSARTRTVVRVYLVRHGETNWNLRGKIQGGGYDVPLNDNGREQARKSALALRDIPLDIVASSSLARAKETADIVWEHHRRGGDNANNNNNAKDPLRIVDKGFDEMRFGIFEGFGYKKRVHGQEEKNPAAEEMDPERVKVLEGILAHFLVEKDKVKKDTDYCFPSRAESSSATVDAEDEIYQVGEDFGKGESQHIVEERSVGGLSRTIDAVLNEQEQPQGGGETKHVAIVSHGRTNKVLLASMMTGDVRNGYGTVEQSNANINVLDYTYEGPEDSTDRLPSSWKGVWTARLLNYTDHV